MPDPPDPLDAAADRVPSVGRRQLVLVDGRTFAISNESGQMVDATHGMVHDDLRHLSTLTATIDGADVDVLASSAPTPLSAVVVGRLTRAGTNAHTVMTRRRWVAGGLREDIHVHNTSPLDQRWVLRVRLLADFAHVFDVKAGLSGPATTLCSDDDGWTMICAHDVGVVSRIRVFPQPDDVDLTLSTMSWNLDVPGRRASMVTITVEPVVDDVPAGLAFPCGMVPADAIPMRRLASWQASVPRIVSTDPRLAVTLDQALADIASLRIMDSGHMDRAVIAAGAPWFMTLFGRDSLLTSWMTLPFEPSLAVGVLCSLADLRGRIDDPVAEEQPGKILHELRRHGGGGPFATRSRYYGTVDATPLFVMLAAEAWRWGALTSAELQYLAPAVDAAIEWIVRTADAHGDGFVEYQRSDPSGLSNQGWKDSWDGVTFADGSFPTGPIALAEVQGYVYAALRGAAELVEPMRLQRGADDLTARADRLYQRFNESFWNERGWFSMGVDGTGRQIDALTTNPGHALWTGIADPGHACQYLDRLTEPAMWTGWGLRTLADTMGAYDPLSYHNGSVWPHDTALCAAGAARYGRWDVVDQIFNGAFDAAREFGGRPPELFSGISRTEAPIPVAYPSSCSPQAWASASILLMLRNLLDLRPNAARNGLEIGRTDMSATPDLMLDRVVVAGRLFSVRIIGKTGTVAEIDH